MHGDASLITVFIFCLVEDKG
uniref:Uncharacterized protein n=1 Tax=Arundo donax TaxID=35708 RepID=A0A0A9H0J7_ARUDO